jgi:hypothetical protein
LGRALVGGPTAQLARHAIVGRARASPTRFRVYSRRNPHAAAPSLLAHFIRPTGDDSTARAGSSVPPSSSSLRSFPLDGEQEPTGFPPPAAVFRPLTSQRRSPSPSPSVAARGQSQRRRLAAPAPASQHVAAQDSTSQHRTTRGPSVAAEGKLAVQRGVPVDDA